MSAYAEYEGHLVNRGSRVHLILVKKSIPYLVAAGAKAFSESRHQKVIKKYGKCKRMGAQ